MAKKWRDIRHNHSPEVEAEIASRVKDAVRVMALYQVREARNLTQVNLAKVLNVNQGAVSRMEKRTDMYVSTLRNFIQAMGGQLQVKAIFPEAEIEIDQFENLAKPQEEDEFGETQTQPNVPENQSNRADAVNVSL
jgi:transcriptional regulator with XRE-family HTH domain